VSDRNNNDLAALLTPAPSRGVQFSQGKILTWERGGELRNTIEWRGITLTDIPIVEGVNALALKPGDIVGMLGWAPENAKGVGTWWILGKLSNPGEFVSDLTFFLGQIRFMTKQNPDVVQAYFGWSAADGTPLTILYYGDSAETRALQIANENSFLIRDPSGNAIFENDSATGVGLAQPYLNYYLVPSTSAETDGSGAFSLIPSTTSVAYIGLYEGTNSLWHPSFSYRVFVTTAGGGNADWQILFDGTVAASGTGTGAGVAAVPGWGTVYNPGSDANVTVNLRATGGATRAYVSVTRMYGRQS